MTLLAIIPARGGSKGVPRKNIRSVAGKPLIAWSIEAAKSSTSVSRVIVSTEDPEIAKIAQDFGAEVLTRPADLARDETPTLPVLQHVVDHLKSTENWQSQAVLTLQPTSPLRTAQHIDEAWSLFASDPHSDSLVSCLEVPHIFHPRSVMRLSQTGYLEPWLSEPQPTRRQDKETVYARNGAAIYITRTERLVDFVFGGCIIPYKMSEQDSIDIDTEDDLLKAEALLLKRQEIVL